MNKVFSFPNGKLLLHSMICKKNFQLFNFLNTLHPDQTPKDLGPSVSSFGWLFCVLVRGFLQRRMTQFKKPFYVQHHIIKNHFFFTLSTMSGNVTKWYNSFCLTQNFLQTKTENSSELSQTSAW